MNRKTLSILRAVLKVFFSNFYIILFFSTFPQFALAQRREYYDDYESSSGGFSLLAIFLMAGPFLLAHRHNGGTDREYSRSLVRWFVIIWGSFILFAVSGIVEYFAFAAVIITIYGLFFTDK